MEKEKKSRGHTRVRTSFSTLLKWVDECGAWNYVEARWPSRIPLAQLPPDRWQEQSVRMAHRARSRTLEAVGA